MHKRLIVLLTLALAGALLLAGVALADDGIMFRKNVSHTPDQETERANINHMAFYVPAQTSAGELISMTYTLADGSVLTETRDFAKPLVAVYIDALPEHDDEEEGIYSILSGGAGLGQHDAYAALSLDDGATWKRTNLSNSAHLSSFTLQNGAPFPGDAHNMTFAIAGDKVLVGWISRYCDGGLPGYTWTEETLSPTIGITDTLYPDLFGVAGSQGSVDYTLQGFPEVGEIPYSCVWSARGQLLPQVVTDTNEITTYDIVWTKAERLTSGRRDANRLEINGDAAAGFMMVWQEDPEGLRPGQGLGPGEGWSGAVVNGQTDLWYSYISMDDFVMVDEDGDTSNGITPISIDEYDLSEEGGLSGVPKVAVPMAVPIRLTDNAMCKVGGQNPLPYCYINFEDVDGDGNLILPDELPTTRYEDGSSTFCASTVTWTPPGAEDGDTSKDVELCVAKDGRVMQGRVGASRPRVNVQPYDADGDGIYDNAWVILGAEESKALGEGAPDETGGGQPGDEEPPDIGKNMWYYSFDMLNPRFVMQGGMLNQPAKCNPYVDTECVEGAFLTMLEDDFGHKIYQTEISRRFSHMSQPIHQIGPAGISSVLIVKQGIINQGGPADIFLRFTRVPTDTWVACPEGSPYERCLPAGYNPYAYENLVCDEWADWTQVVGADEQPLYPNGVNPRYVEGLCLSNMVNVSGTTIVACENVGTDQTCAEAFPWTFGEELVDDSFPKVTEWRQCDVEAVLSDDDPDLPDYACGDTSNLDDQSWENPYDVAKGHRGFIDGDFIMMMYAWSPNWKANSVGNDHYNLYIRRSFDGGVTWTTTPTELGGEGEPAQDPLNPDPTACENYGAGLDYTTRCFEYAAGEFEQARNVSQLTGNKVTILDPRYTPTGGLKMLPITDLKGIGFTGYDDDIRDPSKFFIVYETGDNTTVSEGEATPLDLFYSRATNWGDDYDLVEYPTGDGSGAGETYWGFDWLEHDREDLSGEAANTCNNGGTFYYVIWNQWQEDEFENVSNSDAIFRRVMFVDDENTAGFAPISSLLYVNRTILSLATNDELILVATAKGFGAEGEIEEVIWYFKAPGDTSSGAGNVIATQKMLQIRAQELVNQPGWAGQTGSGQFTFVAKDKGGRWSPGVTVNIAIWNQVHGLFIPTVTR